MSQGTQNKEKMKISMTKKMSANIDGKSVDRKKKKAHYNLRKQRKERDNWSD